ncbi:unnamed protein product [Aphanomyces euteiches]
MASIRRVWFVIADSSGNPIKGATSKVEIPSNMNIADFKQKVSAKYDQLGDVLEGIHPPKLDVYTSKAAFDNKESPLDPRSKIGEVLINVDALFVVVPADARPAKKMKLMGPVPRGE